MDRKRKKELLAAYKERHPEMGVISFRCRATGDVFLTTASDTAAKFNRICFQLSAGQYPDRRLQELWTQYERNGFELQTVKCLDYEDPAEDHTEELETLLALCLLEIPEARRL